MNRSALLFGVLILLLIGILSAFLFLGMPGNGSNVSDVEDPFSLSDPFAWSQGGTGARPNPDSIPENAAMKKLKSEVSTQEVAVPDGDYSYYELGSVDTASSTPYVMYYFEADKSVQIILYEQPIGKTRRMAEADFLKTYSLSEDEACSLIYQVTVPLSVDSEYFGMNLGFSFCPGSVVLTEI
jgi:hypothetical protein